MQPISPRYARMLAQTAFDDASDLARDGENLPEAILRAQEGIATLRMVLARENGT